jgi:RNAse (barnase) inhibitor barstar
MLPHHALQPIGALDREALRRWASESGQRLFEIDLKDCRTRDDVLRSIARALELPAWFGMNLDALYDAITDLRDRGTAAGYVIVLTPLPRSAAFSARQRLALLDVFRDAVDDYAAAGIPLRVLYG